MPPTLVLMAGLPGSGKSTLALALGRRLGWPVIDKDTVKSNLLALGATEGLAGPASYVLLYELARDLIAGQGLSLILDRPAGYQRVIDATRGIVCDGGGSLRVILCLASQETRNQRLASRTPKLSQPRPPTQTEGEGRERFPHLPEHTLVLSTERALEESVREATHYIMTDTENTTAR